jgi:hypothetical protein
MLTERGAITLQNGRTRGGLVLAGVVGDGIERVTSSDGATATVFDNVFAIELGVGVNRVTLSGPVGPFDVAVPRAGSLPRNRPDRSREREVVGIRLERGKRASIRVAPNRGGGRCAWTYIQGQLRTFGCRGVDDRLPFDLITTNFHPGGPGYPFVYGGELAPEVGGIEMRFRDGTRERLPIVDGFVLHEVPRSRTGPGRRPVSVTTFDRAGRPLVRDELPYFDAIARQQKPRASRP